MNKKISFLSLFVAITLSLYTGCSELENDSEITDKTQDTADETTIETSETSQYVLPDMSRGSAGSMEGKTVIVSIAASDDQYSWTVSDEDNALLDDIDCYIGIACNYLVEQAGKYGCDSEYVYDFRSHQDLYYEHEFSASLSDVDNLDEPVWEYIESSIDTQAILKEYQADNLIFLVLINSDFNNDVMSCTRAWYTGMPYPYELVYMFNKDNMMQVNSPAVYAHEFLHAFGAPDLYQPDATIGLDRQGVRNVHMAVPNDIMLTCYDLDINRYVYDKVTNDITEVTAYYVGLAEATPLLDKIGIH